MTSIGKMFGGKRPPEMVRKDQLTELIRQLRETGHHEGRPATPTMERARARFMVKEGKRGGWCVVGAVQGRVTSDHPVHWNAATNGGAWVHAAAGWWRTEAEAAAALDVSIQLAYADEVAQKTAETEQRKRHAALRAEFEPRLRVLEARAKAMGEARYGLSFISETFSLCRGSRPINEESLALEEAIISAAENAAVEAAAFVAATPPLVERLTALGVRAESAYDGVRLVVDGRWHTQFPRTAAGLQELATYVENEERRHTVPVEAKKLDLSGLFGGAVTRKK